MDLHYLSKYSSFFIFSGAVIYLFYNIIATSKELIQFKAEMDEEEVQKMRRLRNLSVIIFVIVVITFFIFIYRNIVKVPYT